MFSSNTYDVIPSHLDWAYTDKLAGRKAGRKAGRQFALSCKHSRDLSFYHKMLMISYVYLLGYLNKWFNFGSFAYPIWPPKWPTLDFLVNTLETWVFIVRCSFFHTCICWLILRSDLILAHLHIQDGRQNGWCLIFL